MLALDYRPVDAYNSGRHTVEQSVRHERVAALGYTHRPEFFIERFSLNMNTQMIFYISRHSSGTPVDAHTWYYCTSSGEGVRYPDRYRTGHPLETMSTKIRLRFTRKYCENKKCRHIYLGGSVGVTVLWTTPFPM